MPHVRQPRVVVSFATTSMAMKMERCCREEGVPGRLIPVPRQIAAGCGLAWSAPVEARDAVEAELQRRQILIDGIHLLEL